MLVIRKPCMKVGVGGSVLVEQEGLYVSPRYMFSLTSGMVWGLGVERPMGVGLVT